MNGVLAALRRQPVRTYLYGLLGPAVAVAGAYGLVSQERGFLWIGLGGAVLLPFGVEAARAKVTPVAAPHDNEGRPLGAVVDVPVFRSTSWSTSDDVVAIAPVGMPYIAPPPATRVRATGQVRLTRLDGDSRPYSDPIVFGPLGVESSPPT